MDILTQIKPIKARCEASYESLRWHYKIGVAIILVSLATIVLPQKTFASEMENETNNMPMVFEAGDHSLYLDEIIAQAEFKYKHETAVGKLRKQMRLNQAVKDYLTRQGSPLAPYTSTLLQQNNWKKIIALSNAESSMCKRYIEHLANCWGVGGSDLWDMGENLGEGVAAMNDFLNTAPRRSTVKYSKMNFEQMNGLYKQPPGDHWVYNNLEVWNELTAIEKSVR